MTRDASQYNEASERPDMTALDKLPDVIRQLIADNWSGELPRTEAGFVKQCSQLAAVALVALLREGKLTALLGEISAPDSGLAEFISTEILHAPNPRLMAECCDLTFRLKITGKTETQISLDYGMTRSNVSAICTGLKKAYTGKPGLGMKSNKAVEKYKRGMVGRRAKPLGEPFDFGKRLMKKIGAMK